MTYAEMIALYRTRVERRHKRHGASIVAGHQAVFTAIDRGEPLEGSPLMAEAENVLFALESWATYR